jgi:tetratricopeptide (TPR) repeat protein
VFLKACALYDAGMLDEALSSFETALAINQGNAEAWFYKGKALESLGRKTEAEECFQRASRLREP